MGDRGYFGNKVTLFPSLLLGLTFVVIITIVAVGPDTWNLSRSNPTASDERLLRQKIRYREKESEDVQSSSTIANRPREDRAKDNFAAVEGSQEDEESNGRSEVDILGVFRAWDSEVGCGKFKAKLQGYKHRNSSFRSLQPADLVKCTDLQKQHVSVLVKTSTWIPDSLNGFQICSCGLSCLWTKSEMVADDPDLHFYEGDFPPFQRNQGQPLRGYIEMEAHRKGSNQEDIFVGYHAKDHVQATYASNALSQDRNQYISRTKRSDVLVYWSSSRCLPQRQNIASGFLPLISHHSFGKCFNNVGRRPDSDEDPLFDMYPQCKSHGGEKGWTHHIHCAMSHYMFALAIENTMTESYVTEKLFYALDVGTVPIYFGAPNVLDLVPPNSIILASQFNSTEELVAYVKEVAQDPVQYAEFHAWRRCGELGNYRHTWAVSFDTLPCRLCAAVSKLGGKGAPAGGTLF